METYTRPFIDFAGDATLAALLDGLEPHASKPLVIRYDGRTIRPGYHVTEVKAGSFVTLDCGGNPDAWQETILQVEDLGLAGEAAFMPAGKFRAILTKVAGKITLDPRVRVTFEVGLPGEAMQVFDAGTLEIAVERLILQLKPRAAICKPRHRAAQLPSSSRAACCGSGAASPCCT